MQVDVVSGAGDVAALVDATFQPLPACDGPGAIGLESEHFLLHIDRNGTPIRRVTLAEMTAMLDDHPGLDPEPPTPRAISGWRTADGARLMPEPGAQLEYAGAPAASGTVALGALSASVRDIAALLAPRQVVVASAGIDVWSPLAATPQQLDMPRYPAMHEFLARRGPHGHSMMTNTASLQVNLDLGRDGQPADRWTTAMLCSPLTTATFASSPGHGAVSARGVVWQWLDPTRTGVPAAFTDSGQDPVAIMTDAALRADVLLFQRDGTAHPGEPGFSLADWVRDGHPEHGRPTADDVAYHLTTLFPEVRARGFLEVRSVDALPDRWRMVPVVLLAGLLYDDRARDTARAVLEPHREHLAELLRRAAHVGVADGALCALAVEVWTAAAEGARRLGADYFDPSEVRRAEQFLDRFTLRGRCPSDELRDRLREGPTAALDWAREPVGTLTLC